MLQLLEKEEDVIPSKQAPSEQIVLHYAIVHEQSQENRYTYQYLYTLVLIIYQLSTRK